MSVVRGSVVVGECSGDERRKEVFSAGERKLTRIGNGASSARRRCLGSGKRRPGPMVCTQKIGIAMHAHFQATTVVCGPADI